MEGLLPESANFINALNSKLGVKFISVGIKGQETAMIGKLNGLCVILHSWTNTQPCICYIDNYHRDITYIAGRALEVIPCNFIWEGDGSNTSLKITSKSEDISQTSYFRFYLLGGISV